MLCPLYPCLLINFSYSCPLLAGGCSPQDESEVLRRVGGYERHVVRYVVESDGDEMREGKPEEGSKLSSLQVALALHSQPCCDSLRCLRALSSVPSRLAHQP